MKKGQIVEGMIERLDFPNKGILSAADETIIVKNTLPGQKIRACVNKARKGRKEARLLEVLEAGPLETREAPCPVFGLCGGCAYQTIPYGKQIKLKEEQVLRLLQAACGSGFSWEGILTGPSEWGYRNKMEFSFGDTVKDGPLVLGLHKKGSFYDIVDASACKIVHSDYNKITAFTTDFFRQSGLPFYKKMTHQGYLRHLLVRRAVKTEELLICLVTTSQEKPDLEPYREGLLSLPLAGRIAGILHIVNDSLADVVQSDHTEVLYGRDFFYEELLGLKFKISTFSFFQTNTLGAEVLYQKAREYAGGEENRIIFDLYSGAGTIAQVLAPAAKKVIGVELVEEAVLAARENAALNGLSNCSFIAGDVLRVIDEIDEKPDLLILDPPREGIHPKAIDKIGAHIRVKKIIYISCKPTSLVRDLVILQGYGYKVGRVCCVDMFTHTANIETVCELILTE